MAKPSARRAGVQQSEEAEASTPPGDQIFDIRPMTVGLVKRGANRRSFFLAKSQEGVPSMPDSELDLSEAESEELDALVAEIEQARGKPPAEPESGGDPAPEEHPEDCTCAACKSKGKEMHKSVVEKISDALTLLSQRRSRDPILAAQRALGTIGGHPELMSAAKLLMDFLEAARKRNPNAGTEPEPDYGYPSPMLPHKPAPGGAVKKDGEETEPGQFSVAQQAAPAPIEGAPMTQPTPVAQAAPVVPPVATPAPATPVVDIKAQIDAAVAPLLKALEEEKSARQALEQNLAKSAETAELVQLAKSYDLSVEDVTALKALPEEQFKAMAGKLSRLQKAAEVAGFFGEVGHASPIPGSDSVDAILLQKAAELRANSPMDLGAAVIEASRITGMGLERPRAPREER